MARYLITILLTAIGFQASAVAQSATTLAAREVYTKHQDALVVITAISTIHFTTDGAPLPTQDRKAQTLGTIINKKGLIMISNSAIDMAVGMVGNRGRPAGSDGWVTVQSAQSRFQEIQVNLSDGSEFHATKVDEDLELDVAFLLLDQNQVASRTAPLPFVDLSNKITEGDVSIADEVIGLSRSSPVYAYIPSVIPGYITAISKRNVTYYITTAGTAQGIPIFSLDGKFVGLTVQRIIDGKRTNLLGTLGGGTVKSMADLAAAMRGGS
ncbi:MAG: trypsin-like peptidase domain-containing protein [Verrucomicrobiota bacterium]